MSAPLLVHIAQHYFIGLGPYLSYDLSDSGGAVENLGTTLGVSSLVGGWL
jgi:hypothetical protein